MKAERRSVRSASGAPRRTIASASLRMSVSSRLAFSGSKFDSRISQPRTTSYATGARSMQWRRAAERDQGPRPQILATFDRMHARRIGHVLVDHFADPKRGMFGGEIEIGADSFGNAALSGAGVEPHL